MIEIYTPLAQDIAKLQERETAFYWSACAPALLRKHGFRSCVQCTPSRTTARPAVVLRGTRVDWKSWEGATLFEGPVEGSVLRHLELEAADHVCEKVGPHR